MSAERRTDDVAADKSVKLSHRRLPMSLCFYAEDTEAVFFVVESDALDDAGDFLRRRSAFKDYDFHPWGFIFPRTVCLGAHMEGDFVGIWPNE